MRQDAAQALPGNDDNCDEMRNNSHGRSGSFPLSPLCRVMFYHLQIRCLRLRARYILNAQALRGGRFATVCDALIAELYLIRIAHLAQCNCSQCHCSCSATSLNSLSAFAWQRISPTCSMRSLTLALVAPHTQGVQGEANHSWRTAKAVPLQGEALAPESPAEESTKAKRV